MFSPDLSWWSPFPLQACSVCRGWTVRASGARFCQGCGADSRVTTVGAAPGAPCSQPVSPLPSCHRDPEGADLRGEAGSLQRGRQRQGRRLLRVLGLRARLRASGAAALRGRHREVKPAHPGAGSVPAVAREVSWERPRDPGACACPERVRVTRGRARDSTACARPGSVRVTRERARAQWPAPTPPTFAAGDRCARTSDAVPGVVGTRTQRGLARSVGTPGGFGWRESGGLR